MMIPALVRDGLIVNLRCEPSRIPQAFRAIVSLLPGQGFEEAVKKFFRASKMKSADHHLSAWDFLLSPKGERVRDVLLENLDRFVSDAGLSEDRARLERLFEDTPEGTLTFNGSHSLSTANPILESLARSLDVAINSKVSPWLGTIVPSQGKKYSLLATFVRTVRGIYGKSSHVLILSAGRVVPSSLIAELVGLVPIKEIGRFDDQVKEPRTLREPSHVMIAGALPLLPALRNWPQGQYLSIILEEASFLQDPVFQSILTYFDFANLVQEGKTKILIPKAGLGIVIGLSAYEEGLKGFYRIGEPD